MSESINYIPAYREHSSIQWRIGAITLRWPLLILYWEFEVTTSQMTSLWIYDQNSSIQRAEFKKKWELGGQNPIFDCKVAIIFFLLGVWGHHYVRWSHRPLWIYNLHSCIQGTELHIIGAGGPKAHFWTLRWPLLFCVGSLKSPLSEMPHLSIYNLHSSIQGIKLNARAPRGTKPHFFL